MKRRYLNKSGQKKKTMKKRTNETEYRCVYRRKYSRDLAKSPLHADHTDSKNVPAGRVRGVPRTFFWPVLALTGIKKTKTKKKKNKKEKWSWKKNRRYMELIYVIHGPARARASIEHRPAFLSREIYLCITFCPWGATNCEKRKIVDDRSLSLANSCSFFVGEAPKPVRLRSGVVILNCSGKLASIKLDSPSRGAPRRCGRYGFSWKFREKRNTGDK